MGVPKFFRYTSERYPCLNELVKQSQIPDFDNMYLDMNGIVHNCSHPDDSNPHFRITEEKIFADIFHYLSILFQIIKPKKLFFMAIDGVAPRAKMNQQRGRRFRTAREAETLQKKAQEKGEELPKENRFDSNCITPGTVFMARLHQQLKYFIKRKMSTDPLWAGVRVILSGHETPGEGEHKIMDYIRWARSQPDYDPNTRHCLYGLDADLVMLGMCTHEPHFALLREEVTFSKNSRRITSPEETNFYLLHLSLLREYLEQEFIEIKNKLPFEYDLEKVVDDWVLMGFLVGNDFIPNLPNMHIANDALPLLYKTYMTVLPKLDGYINEMGELNLARFEIFMEELAKFDKESFQETYADLKYFEEKTGRRPNAAFRKEYKPNDDETFDVNIDEIKKSINPDLQALISATDDMLFDNDDCDPEWETDNSDVEDEGALFDLEFKLHKKDYYTNKLDYSKVTEEVLRSQAECYVRAIQWNLYYYYKGCPSWCWFYPHHYAPYMSDIKGFRDFKITFELGKPFLPFEQLLAVLPAASKSLLPEPYHDLMMEENSPIFSYYPVDFDTDLNGKKNDWEAVVLIPFIDEKNLLAAMKPKYEMLTDEEKRRNTHGPILIYDYSKQSLGTAEAPEYFPPIKDCHAKETLVWKDELDVPPSMLKSGVLPNAHRDKLFPGFPTTKHLKFKTYLKKEKVKVFDQPSRNDNMIIELIREPVPKTLEDYESLLGQIVWVGWPHLVQAKVTSISNEQVRLNYNEKTNKIIRQVNDPSLCKQWNLEQSTIIEHNKCRLGIELGTVDIIIHAVNLKGYKYLVSDRSKLVLEPEWCTVSCGYAAHTVLTDLSAYIVQELTRFATPEQMFKRDDPVFLLTAGHYYGCLGKIVSSEETSRTGRVRVSLKEDVDVCVDICRQTDHYKNAHQSAVLAGISTLALSQITGCVFVYLGERRSGPTEALKKVNIGFNLKYNKTNMEVAGYTRCCPETRVWYYSDRCLNIVKEYKKKYYNIFELLSRSNNENFFESDLWPNDIGSDKLQEVVDWLSDLPHRKAMIKPCGSEVLEDEELLEVRKKVQEQLVGEHMMKNVTLQIKMTLLYKPNMHTGDLYPDKNADFKMYDRIICCSDKITVPLGLKGIIVGVLKKTDVNTVRLSDKLNVDPSYLVMFDDSFPGGMSNELINSACLYRMAATNMINISYGRNIRCKQPERQYSARRNNMAYNRATQVETYKPLYNQTAGRQYNINDRQFGNNERPNRKYDQSVENQDDSFIGPKPTTVLRRDDGHGSAFACYSPSKEKTSKADLLAQSWRKKELEVVQPPQEQSSDPSSDLLMSLLKISAPNDKTKQQEPNQVSKHHMIPPVPLSNQNNFMPFNNQQCPNLVANNWRTSFPMAPNFVQQQVQHEQPSILGPPPILPMPRFNNPPQTFNNYQQAQSQSNIFSRNQFNDPTPSKPNRMERAVSSQQTFSMNKDWRSKQPDKVPAHFVPLQAIASQRRKQQPKTQELPSEPALTSQNFDQSNIHQPENQNINEALIQENRGSIPKRKRKPRLAATFPFNQ